MGYTELKLPNGGRWEYWLREVEAIQDFVKQHSIKPINEAALSAWAGGFEAASAGPELAAAPRVRFPGFPGGIRIAHLHLNGVIYGLNDAQWAEFSRGIIAAAKAKLEKVKSVTFEQAMEVAAATETLC